MEISNLPSPFPALSASSLPWLSVGSPVSLRAASRTPCFPAVPTGFYTRPPTAPAGPKRRHRPPPSPPLAHQPCVWCSVSALRSDYLAGPGVSAWRCMNVFAPSVVREADSDPASSSLQPTLHSPLPHVSPPPPPHLMSLLAPLHTYCYSESRLVDLADHRPHSFPRQPCLCRRACPLLPTASAPRNPSLLRGSSSSCCRCCLMHQSFP